MTTNSPTAEATEHQSQKFGEMKIYGPYKRKDGRQHVIHYDEVTKTKRTQSYPRYLMEQHLGRKLEDWEEVDHINNDPTDDRIENFQLLTKSDNIKKSAKKTEWEEFTCPICNIDFLARMRDIRGNQGTQKKRGPYCSKRCAGLAGVRE